MSVKCPECKKDLEHGNETGAARAALAAHLQAEHPNLRLTNRAERRARNKKKRF